MKATVRPLSVCLGLTWLFSLACIPALAQSNECVWALNTSASGALSISGSVVLSAPGCGVVVDSTSSSAMSFSGSGSFTAKYFDIAGNYTQSGAVTFSPTPVTGSRVPAPPLSFLVPPTSSSCTYTNFKVSTGSQTLSPGTYCNGIAISGATNVTFKPGTYILMGGGLNVSGSSILSGTGVTFFLTQGLGYSYGPLSIAAATVMTLKAPTCGSLEGILFYQNPGIGTGKAASSLTGSTASTLEGALYFPTTSLTYSGAAAGYGGNYLTIVADTISLTGSAALNDNYGGLCNAGPLAPPVAVSVTPATATLTAGQPEQFTATVTNANPSETGVTWTIAPAGLGSISKSGLYTAPAPIGIPQTVTVTATSVADPTKSASATVTLMPPQTPVITWAAPAPITYGTALSTAQLDARASVPGTFAYAPASGTILAAGSQTLNVTFTPTNTTGYTTATAKVVLTVNKATPVITWAAPAPITYGMALGGTQLDATASVAGTFAYSPTAGTVLAAGGQALSVTFTPTNTTDYTTATASAVLPVNKAPLTIAASNASRSYGAANPTFGWTPSGFVNGDTASVLSGSPSLTTTATTASPVGSYPITAAQGTLAAANYTFTFVAGTLTVNQATTAITCSPSAITYGTALSASNLNCTAGGVAGGFSYTPALGTVLSAGTQPIAVTFTPTDSTDYAAATASVMLTVNPATPVITWPAPAPITYGTALSATQLDATANVPGTFAYSPAAGTVLAAGSQTLNVTFVPADSTDYAAATASVMLTVNQPVQCISNGYSYVRAITIDHAKVPNTDQANFPFLFETTDPLLASTANNGHVTNPNGYDIIFTSDPAGQNPLPYETEEYNPVTGQLIAWIELPTLSHTTDTTVYLFYGNPNVMAPQQNPAAVWDSNYKGVWHLGDGSSLSLNDSTSNANNATDNGAVVAPGPFAGAMQTNGSTYATIGTPSSLANLAQGPATFSAWINSAPGSGGILMGKDDGNGSRGWALSLNANHDVDFVVVYSGGDFRLDSIGLTPNNAWSYLVVTLNGSATQSGSATIYINGVPSGSGSGGSGVIDDDSAQVAYLANATYGDQVSTPFNGTTAEFRISNTIRSADWIATEYANQSSPSTFYSIGSEGPFFVSPATATLSAGQSQLFTATCNAVSWSIPPTSPGAISGDGIYTAPSSIAAPQSVVITAASLTDPSETGTAIVTLLPAPLNPKLTLAASIPPPYVVGSTQQFTATFTNRDGSPISGVTVTFTVSGANATSASSTTDSNGDAIFTYTGTNSGSDVIQASTGVASSQITSNAIPAFWIVPVSAISTTSVTGMFFPNNGPVFNFDTLPTAIPLFTQTFPSINFNPPTGAIPGNTTVGVGTRPFTDVVTDEHGSFVGTIPAQGNGWEPGVVPGNFGSFQTVFTGSFIVASGGNAVISVYVDNSFILGIGGGATAVDGPGGVTPFYQFPVAGALSTSIGGTSMTVNFPGPGTYPYELDYVECCGFGGGDTLSLVMTAGAPNGGSGTPPTASLVLSPNSVQPQPLGGQESFSVLATDASGVPVPNLSVSLVVSYVDAQELTTITDSTGHATFTYKDLSPGTASVQAVAVIDGMVTYSNQVTVPWTLPAASATGSGGSGTLTVSISAQSPVVLPSTLQLNGSAADTALPSGTSPSVTWSEVSGPGTVTFANPQQAATTAAFSAAGNYVLQLSASDSLNSGSAQISIEVDPAAGVTQGWIGSPANGSGVSGLVPITVAAGKTLASGTLTYYPSTNPNSVTVLNGNTTGSGQIGLLDTTTLQNGSYWITLQATDTSGSSAYNLVLVTVTGSYKPGRVTTTVTDLVVPSTGLAINVQRTYDSLNAATIGDFGYGWNLGINVNLTVDSKGDVTFTLGGQRRTFYLTPQMLGCSPLIGCLFPWFSPIFTAEPGLHGTLSDSGPGCLFDMLLADDECVGGGYYNPPGYIYTDPNGTAYTISASGALQSIVDRSGNGLTITPNGITSTTGLNVPFVRDSQNRITKITDPQGNVYKYGYDTNGNLASVTYPSTPNAQTCSGADASNTSQYSYYPDAGHPDYPSHYYAGGTDARCNPLPSTSYYGSGEMDASGAYSVAGKLSSVTDALGETTSYTYNLATNTTVITYPTNPADGNGEPATATLVYDSMGDVLSSTDPLGLTTANTYDAKQDLLSTTDPLNHTTTYTYDGNGNRISQAYPNPQQPGVTNTTSHTSYNQYSEPISTTDEDGNARTFNYDANFNPQSVADSLGTLMSTIFSSNGTMQSGAIGYDITQNPSQASQFSYDANGNLIAKTDALGRTTSYTYNSLGQKITMTEPIPAGSTAAAATTTYSYDPFGNLTQTQAPLGRTTSSTYDANGNKLSDTDARGYLTNYKYDALNRLLETDYPDGHKTSKTYDFRNNIITETDQNGNITCHQYDLSGRQTSVTQACGTANATTTSYAYDNAGRKTSETDNLNHVTNYTYDAAGNLLSTSGVGGNFSYAYDNARNRISQTDGNGNTTKYAYDARKRLTVTTYPDHTAKTNAYDGPGNLISVVDQAQNEVDYTYDAANQLSKVIQVSSPNSANTTIYGYDANGNPIALEDANNHQTIQNFNLLSELASKTLPDGTLSESRTYDNNGNVQTVQHFNGITTTYTYDSLNRLLSRATPGETTVSFTYTPTGKYATSTDASGTTSYSYDSMDRLTAKATPEGTLSYTYDAAGHVAGIASSNTNGASMSYTYDDLDRLSTITDNRLTGSNTTTYSYDSASNVATVTYPNGVQSTFTYDTQNRVTGLSSAPASYSYDRGPTGNLTGASESSGRTVNWTYDGIYRLTNETIALAPSGHNGNVSYGLDPVGNRLTESSSLSEIPSGASTFNADDELSSESYDANGNVTAAGGKSFTYDSENRLVSMSAGGNSVSMVYDAFGNRVAKAVNGVTTQYLVESDLNPTGYPQVFDELNSSGVVTRTYTYGLQRIDEDQVTSNVWTPSFYGYDGGGNVRQLTNLAGSVTDSYEYDAFGNEFTVSGGSNTPNEMMYRGEQYDSDLGLYYLRARYYNPLTGRFMSRDPEDGQLNDPKTLHKYLYAGGDPIDALDPTGRADLFETALIEGGSLRAGIVPALVELVGGTATQIAAWAATIEQYIGIAYLTFQDITAVIADIAVTRGIVKTFFCGTGGFLLGKFLGEHGATDAEKWAAGLAFSYVCGGAVPLPGPKF